ncbi:thioesterase family protein [Thalassoglobus neptunius]|uniref:thioesterase family protein n=1 Tax=Thalassoglobus neptunius TaxID=1938619 RepID=UPI0011B741EA|nr:hypothetical protein [Thalassoglobus neptunius]
MPANNEHLKINGARPHSALRWTNFQEDRFSVLARSGFCSGISGLIPQVAADMGSGCSKVRFSEFVLLRFSRLVKSMKSIPKVSQSHRFTKTIDESLTIQFDGLPPVLSTPHLIWNLETAAMELLDEFLSDGEISLGVHVDVEHLSAALIGDSVQFRATVVNASEKEVLFRVDATLAETVVSRGLHRRRIVSIASLRKRLQR